MQASRQGGDYVAPGADEPREAVSHEEIPGGLAGLLASGLVSEWDVRAWVLSEMHPDGPFLPSSSHYRLRNGPLQDEFEDVASDVFGGLPGVFVPLAVKRVLEFVLSRRAVGI